MKPTKAIAVEGTIADGLCGQGKFVRRLEETLGAPVGYKPGDLVSFGSIGPLMPPRTGRTVTATYEGLPGNPSVSVRFK